VLLLPNKNSQSLHGNPLSRSLVTATYRKRPFIGYKKRHRLGGGGANLGVLVSFYVPGGVLYTYKLAFVEIPSPPHRALPTLPDSPLNLSLTTMPQYRYSMRLIHRVVAFPPHAILSGMFYQIVLRDCWFIMSQAALRSYYSYSSILSECWPGCHSDSHAIFYKDWSGASPNQTRPPELVRSSHRHQPGLASLVLPPDLTGRTIRNPERNHSSYFLSLLQFAGRLHSSALQAS